MVDDSFLSGRLKPHPPICLAVRTKTRHITKASGVISIISCDPDCTMVSSCLQCAGKFYSCLANARLQFIHTIVIVQNIKEKLVEHESDLVCSTYRRICLQRNENVIYPRTHTHTHTPHTHIYVYIMYVYVCVYINI